jgi:ABC-type transport system substrate-binding protein
MTVCICVLASINLNCGRERGESGAESSTLTIHLPDTDERSLGPAGYRPSSGVWFLVFLALTLDQDGTEVLRERLLDHWEHTPDYAEWTVRVREGLRWDDGVPVTAEDVKYSLELWTDDEVLYENPSFEEIIVHDNQTLTIAFKKPVTRTIATFDWLPILPKHLLESLEPEDIFGWPFWIQPVGNGPYRYQRHVPDVMTEFTVNPEYYGERPNIPGIVLRYGGNGVTELLGACRCFRMWMCAKRSPWPLTGESSTGFSTILTTCLFSMSPRWHAIIMRGWFPTLCPSIPTVPPSCW